MTAAWQETAALEARLRELEAAIEQLKVDGVPVASTQLATPTVNAPAPGLTPPQVSGLSATGKIQKVLLTWNAVDITDLLRYEIQVSANETFSVFSTFVTNSTAFTIDDVSTDENVSVRVRAVNTTGLNGPFSAIISTNPVLIATANITAGATGQVVYEYNTGSTTYSASSNNVWESTGDSLAITATLGTAIIMDYQFVNSGAADDSGNATDFRIVRDGTVLRTFSDIYTLDEFNTNPQRILFLDTTAGIGTHTYGFEIYRRQILHGFDAVNRNFLIQEILR
jgi:hypothetical protein